MIRMLLPRRGRPLCVLAAMACVWSLAGALDAALVPMTFADLVSRSKSIVSGEVTGLRSYRAPFAGLGDVIFTDVTIRVTSVLHGDSTQREITLQVLGGTLDGRFLKCAESPKYELGEKVLVFVREYNNALWNTGWQHGKYKLSNDGLTVRGVGSSPIANDAPLEQVRAEASRIVAASGAPPRKTVEQGGAR